MTLLASIYKEALIQSRDRAGLAIVFLMPLVLVCIVTVVQENANRAMMGATMPMLVINGDEEYFGRMFDEHLAKAETFRIIRELDGEPLGEDAARAAVARGDYPVCVVIPANATARARQRVAAWVAELLEWEAQDEFDGAAVPAGGAQAPIAVYFDPGVSGLYKRTILNVLQRLTEGIEMGLVLTTMGEAFQEEIREMEDDSSESLGSSDALDEFVEIDVVDCFGIWPGGEASACSLDGLCGDYAVSYGEEHFG